MAAGRAALGKLPSMPKPWKAIAAMSLNRVIGKDNDIPWRIPADSKWFRKCTLGHVIIVGRKTFESFGKKPLPNRQNWILSRKLVLWHINDDPSVRLYTSLKDLQKRSERMRNKKVWVCGGAEIYQQTLPRCRDLFLTVVKREVEGNVYFPDFKHIFKLKKVLRDEKEFEVRHYVNSHPVEF